MRVEEQRDDKAVQTLNVSFITERFRQLTMTSLYVSIYSERERLGELTRK